MGENRKFMRFNVIMDAVCRKGASLKKLKVNNFSREGIGILTKELFDKNEDVEIELMIPGDNMPVFLSGEVAWLQTQAGGRAERKGGIKFKKISNHDRGRVLEYIYRRWIMPGAADTK